MTLLKLKRTLGFLFFIAAHSPIEMCISEEIELKSVVNQCPYSGILIVLDNFNTTAGSERACYQLCGGPYVSGYSNENLYSI